VLHVEQTLNLESDAIRIFSATLRSGQFLFLFTSTVGRIKHVFVSSPDIFDADGTPFEREIMLDGVTAVDMAGARLVSNEVNALHVVYNIEYEAYDFTAPMFSFEGLVSMHDLQVQEMSGWVNSYASSYRVDSAFHLPLDNIEGEITFMDAHLTLWERNSFDMEAELRIDTAMLYGEGVNPSYIFDEYPVLFDVTYAPQYTPFYDEHHSLGMNTELTSVLVSGEFILNPKGFENQVTITDTSSLGLVAEGVLPIKFKIPGAYYQDTIDVNVSDVEAPEIIQEVILYATFESEIPMSLTAQLFTIDDETGLPTDSLFNQPKTIAGSFNGVPTRTETTVSITHARLNNLMNSEKLLLRLGVDTEDNEVLLNIEDKIRLTMKADVLYDGDVDIN